MEIRKQAHCAYRCMYHIVWIPKYRKHSGLGRTDDNAICEVPGKRRLRTSEACIGLNAPDVSPGLFTLFNTFGFDRSSLIYPAPAGGRVMSAFFISSQIHAKSLVPGGPPAQSGKCDQSPEFRSDGARSLDKSYLRIGSSSCHAIIGSKHYPDVLWLRRR